MPVVDPQALLDIAPRWTSDVVPRLEAALAAVARTEAVHYGNFTVVAPSLALVHVEVENFMQQNLHSKIDHATEFRTRLETTAETWTEAEEANTVEDGGC